MAAQLFMWLVAFVIAGFLWFWIVRPILEDWGVIGPYVPPRYDAETKRIVSNLPAAEPAAAHDMSTPAARTNADGADEETDGRVSVADQWLDRFEVDRTKTAAIELMVYSGWTVAQIRAVIKGENAALGAEIDAARQRLGIAPEQPRAIPLRPRTGDERVLVLD